MKHERTARIESTGADGVFEMTLATEGEASDGHILSIRGGTIPERMPLLASHWNDPVGQLGSITNPRKALKDSPPRLQATGNIEMEGPNADVRRDLAHMISKGHVNAVSIRWDEVPGKSVRRVNLPSDHPHYVDAETAKGEERYGVYFEEWVAREGSVVALGADQGALIGRADETEGEVSTFWRAMADDAAPQADESKVAATLSALRQAANESAVAGATLTDLLNAVSDIDALGSEDDFTSCRIGEDTIFLPESLADQLEDERAERAQEETTSALEPEPDQEPEVIADQPSPINWEVGAMEASVDPTEFGQILSDALDEQEARIRRTVQDLIDLRTGKVT